MKQSSGFRWWKWIGLGAFGFALFLVLGVLEILPVPMGLDSMWTHERQAAHQFAPAYVNQDGKEFALVYIGSSTCSFSNDEALPTVVERVKLSLQQKAQS